MMTEKPQKPNRESSSDTRGRVKFEVYGEVMLEKKVRPSGKSGRVYLPMDWVDHQIKIIRID
jgi:putative transposon-encoded protein